MFAVVGSNISLPVTPSLVATPLPGNNAVRVPSTDVAPSVANVQVDNNSQSNRNFTARIETQAPAPTLADDNQFSVSYPPAASRGISAQTTFLAQLAAQDTSAPAKVILVQYEKLLSLGAVKYKPSDAGKPSIAATNLFNSLLKSSAPAAPQNDNPAPAVIEQPAPAPANDNVVKDVALQAAPQPVAAVPARPVQSLAAYAATIRRNQDFAPEKTLESA